MDGRAAAEFQEISSNPASLLDDAIATADINPESSHASASPPASGSPVKAASSHVLPLDEIQRMISRDPFAVDFQLSILSAASRTYRHETTLKPFPMCRCRSSVAETDTAAALQERMDYSVYISTLASLPGLQSIIGNPKCLSPSHTDVVSWMLQQRYKIKSLKLSELPLSVILSEPCPDFVFEVSYPECRESAFSELKATHSSFYGFHGSKAENFHSILSFGLLGNFSKQQVLFGEGVYLSSEMAVSLMYSPTGPGWSKSKIGPSLSCVAVCEVIDHPSVETGSRRHNSELPEKYFLVKNGQLLLVRYVLVHRTARSRLHRRLAAINEEYRWLVLALSLALLAALIHLLFSLVPRDEDDGEYVVTEYAHVVL